MIDSMTHQPMTVSADGTAGPYIIIPLEQLETVEILLRINGVAFWVDSDAISRDGEPELVIINLARNSNAGQIQRLLDAAS